MAGKRRGIITVAAGTNGAGKSALMGEYLARSGAAYFNPDVFARRLMQAGSKPEEANAKAWALGFEGLQKAISKNQDFTFETTLGGHTISRELHRAAQAGLRVRIWYIGLASLQLHIDRVRARVERGGHDIPQEKIRERFTTSRINLIDLLPLCDEVHLFDNSEENADGIPQPSMLFRMQRRRITEPSIEDLLAHTPEWAQPIVAAAVKLHQDGRNRS